MQERLTGILVELCRRPRAAGGLDVDLSPLSQPGAPADFLSFAARHGVRGLVLSRLEEAHRIDPGSVPAADTLLRPVPSLRKQAALWDIEGGRILADLESAGFRPVVLKGGALRHVAYPPGIERWMGDLDLLVEPSEMAGVLERMAELGYTGEYSVAAEREMDAHHYHRSLTHPAGFIVEVHRELTRPAEPIQLDTRLFLDRSHRVSPAAGSSIRVPSSEDMILHLTSQIEQEAFRRFSRFVDLDRVVGADADLDWEYLRSCATVAGLGPTLAASLRVSSLLLSTVVPSWIEDGSMLPGSTRRGIERMRPVVHLLESGRRFEVAADDLFRFWLLPAWSDRRARIRELASRNPDPLQWVWDGDEAPDGASRTRTGGPARVLKLLAYQIWVGTVGTLWTRPAATSDDRRFWARPAGTRGRP